MGTETDFLDLLRHGKAFADSLNGLLRTLHGSENREDDPYAVLGVSRDDPWLLIQKVYRVRVQFLHPDKGGDPGGFRRLNEAYKTVKKEKEGGK